MEPWWTGEQAAWLGSIGGTAIGLLGAAVGTIGGICAPRGKCKALVLSLLAIPAAIGVVSLLGGIVALAESQPYHVYYPLLTSGCVLTLVFGGLLPVFVSRYRQADQRRLEAEELRRS